MSFGHATSWMRQAGHTQPQCVEESSTAILPAAVHGIKATGDSRRGELVGFGLGDSVCKDVVDKATTSLDGKEVSHPLK